MINSAATVAFGFPTSFGLEQNIINTPDAWNYYCVPEQELSVEITNIYCVHVDDMDIFEASERQIGQNLTTKASSPDD